MNDLFDPSLLVKSSILKRFPRPVKLRILMVIDDDAVDFSADGFGLKHVIDTLRSETLGYVNFEVVLAQHVRTPAAPAPAPALVVNATPGLYDLTYQNFRFDAQVAGKVVIQDFHQIWCFPFAPGNNPLGSDADIEASGYRLMPGELEALTTFMNDRKGGVLAMGDHHYLGATMCSRMPRVGTMRRWTLAQGVPPIGGPDRVDTNRPQDAAHRNIAGGSPATIPIGAQEDAIGQPVEWKRYSAGGTSFGSTYTVVRRRPHPLLCGGRLGVIDVFPDHPHEGIVFEDGAVDTTRSDVFGQPEYRALKGERPLPEVIAWGNTLPDPPYRQAKGDSPAKRFGLVGVYDGHPVEVGRVVVDSTWHHWVNMNLVGFIAADGTPWKKIQTYFRNVAIWLAPPAQRQAMLGWLAFWTTFSAAAFEDLVIGNPVNVFGGVALDVLGRRTSDCVVHSLIFDRIPRELLHPPKLREEWPCLSCPPEDVLIERILGETIKVMLPTRDRLLSSGEAGKELDEARLARAVDLGVQRTLTAWADFSAEAAERLLANGRLARALVSGDIKGK